MSTASESPPRSPEERVKVLALDIDEYDLLKYVGTADAAVRGISDMRRMGYKWARGGAFASNSEGPLFSFIGGTATRYNIRPWKRVDGHYWWKCFHPALKEGDGQMLFPDPLTCAVAQEIQGE